MSDSCHQAEPFAFAQHVTLRAQGSNGREHSEVRPIIFSPLWDASVSPRGQRLGQRGLLALGRAVRASAFLPK